MAVVSMVTEPETEEGRELFARLEQGPLGIINLFRVVAHNPTVLRGWLRMATPLLMGGLSLDPRLREIVILRVAQNVRSEYEFGHHIPIARAVGLTDEEIASLQDFEEAGKFSDLERAAIRYVDASSQLTPDAPDLARDLKRWLSDRELLELTFCVGHWNMVARILVPLEVEVDDSLVAELPEGWREWL
jgi:4-carboxymuconolactone decarboxylase